MNCQRSKFFELTPLSFLVVVSDRKQWTTLFSIFSNYFTAINIVEFLFVLIILWIGLNKPEIARPTGNYLYPSVLSCCLLIMKIIECRKLKIFACLDSNHILPCSNFGNVQAAKNFTRLFRKGIVSHLNRELVCQVGLSILTFLACLTSKKEIYPTTKFDSKLLRNKHSKISLK